VTTIDGVVCLVRVFGGQITSGSTIKFASHGKTYQVAQCGIMMPNPVPTGLLVSGMVGYVVCGIRDPREARVGDTILLADEPNGMVGSELKFCICDSRFYIVADSLVLPGFELPRPMLFASLFTQDA
jgi:translation elongation factor EF-4